MTTETKKTKYTPGPWGVNSYGKSRKQPGRFDIGPIGFVDGIVQVVDIPALSDETREANARLISAAPEMAEALFGCRESICKGECDREIDWHSPSCEAIRAALQKAGVL